MKIITIELLFQFLSKYKLSGPITKLWHMVKKIKLKILVVNENILDDFNVAHCGIKVKVTIGLAKLIVQALWSPFGPKYKTKKAT